MSARRPAGVVKIRNEGGWRVVPFTMGGTVRMDEGEWLVLVVNDRPVNVLGDRDMWLLMLDRPTSYAFDPGVVCGPVALRFRRMFPQVDTNARTLRDD